MAAVSCQEKTMELFFDKELLDRAAATPEQIKKAKASGSPFRFEDRVEGIAMSGFLLNGCAYITDVQNLSKTYR